MLYVTTEHPPKPSNSGAADWLKLLVEMQNSRQPLTRAVMLFTLYFVLAHSHLTIAGDSWA